MNLVAESPEICRNYFPNDIVYQITKKYVDHTNTDTNTNIKT